jgi:hypothetical protein
MTRHRTAGLFRLWGHGPALLLLFLTGALAAGCSGISVSTDFDPEAPFNSMKTFDWARQKSHGPRDAMIMNEIMDRRIQRAVEHVLESKGYRRVERGSPDFLVAFHYSVRNRLEVVDYGYGWRRGWRGRSVQEIREGTLLVDIVDRESNQLVWRGKAEGAINDPDEAEERITQVVTKLMERFPPS